MKYYLILLTCLLPALIFGQDYSKEFGKITSFEANMKSYTKDPEAPAVILYDIGETKFIRDVDDRYILEFERTTKIKFFKESGFEYGTIEVPFYHERYKPEKVEIISACTYNMNSDNRLNKSELNKADIFAEKVSENWSILKFTMPNLQEGSIIEFKYTVTSPYLLHFNDWKFQYLIPVKYSLYKAKMIPFYNYVYLLQGANRFDHFTSYEDNSLSRRYGSIEFNDKVYEFGMQDIPAFKDESFITSVEDYIMKLDFQLTTVIRTDGVETNYLSTWPDLAKDLLKHEYFGKYIGDAQKKSADITEKIYAESKDQKELIENLCDYAKANYTWNGRKTIYTSKKVKAFMTEKTGACSDINLFLLGMLKNTDLEARPVILSTRDHGKIKSDYPFTQAFNYVVILVKIDGANILLDATRPLLPYFLIPPDCLNEKGFVLDKKEPYWVFLQESPASLENSTFRLQPNTEKDSVLINATITMNLYDANRLRSKQKNDPDKLIDYIEDKDITLVGVPETRNYFKKNSPYSIGYKGQIPMDHVGRKIYIAPFINEPISVNPFSSAERKYPVDMVYARIRQFHSIIDVPEGYKVDYIPENKKINNDIFDLEYTTVLSDNGKQITVSGIYNFKKAVYKPDEYKLIRYYYIEIIDKFNDKISLIAE